MGLYPIGTLVELNSGEVAVVYSRTGASPAAQGHGAAGAGQVGGALPAHAGSDAQPLDPTGEPYRILGAAHNAYGIDPAEFYLV